MQNCVEHPEQVVGWTQKKVFRTSRPTGQIDAKESFQNIQTNLPGGCKRKFQKHKDQLAR